MWKIARKGNTEINDQGVFIQGQYYWTAYNDVVSLKNENRKRPNR